MGTNKPAVVVIFQDVDERNDFNARAKRNGRSASNEFRALADLPELKHGGKREKSNQETSEHGGQREKAGRKKKDKQ